MLDTVLDHVRMLKSDLNFVLLVELRHNERILSFILVSSFACAMFVVKEVCLWIFELSHTQPPHFTLSAARR